MEQKTKDRFGRLQSDPRFKRLRSRVTKEVIDKDRFGAIFTDPDFQLGTTLDKRGIKNKDRQSVKEDLQRYYKLKDEEDYDVDFNIEESPLEQKIQNKKINKTDENITNQQPSQKQQFQQKKIDKSQKKEKQDQEEEEEKNLDQDVKTRMMRIRGMLENTEDEDLTSDEEEIENDQGLVEDKEVDEWGVGADAANPEENIHMVEHATKRLAVVDLDWQKIRAEDIFLVMRSFVPHGGRIECVTVYPSDYGLEQMKNESLEGPKIIFNNEIQEEENSSDDEGSQELDEVQQRLVIYERSKLRWYYGVIECDSVSTAEGLYNECDGLEFEGTACKFDLRYIPDEMSFQGRQIRDQAKEVSNNYKPPLITGQVPIHTNPSLTWDKDCDVRKNALKFNKKSNQEEMEFDDYKAYLASSSSDDEDEEPKNQQIEKSSKLQQLLSNNNVKQSGWDNRFGGKTWAAQNNEQDGDEDGVHMEVTFTPALESLKQQNTDNKERKETFTKGLSVWKEREQKIKERNKVRKKQGRFVDEENDDQLDDDIDYNNDYQNIQEDEFFNDSNSTDDEQNDDDSIPPQNDDSDSKKFNQKQQKRKNKKRKRKEIDPELELLALDDSKLIDAVQKGDDINNNKNNNKISKKKKKYKNNSDDEIEGVQLDVEDERFKSLFENPEFGVDPTNPKLDEYSRQVVKEIVKRKNSKSKINKSENQDQEIYNGTEDVELKLQVNQIKSKFKNKFRSKKKN